MRINKIYTTTVLFVVASFVFASAAVAQQSRYTRRDVGNIITKLEKSSNTFRQDFDKYLDRSSLNGTNEENRINRIVSNYESALNELRRDFDRNDNWWTSRNNVSRVMDEARAVNSMMNNLSFANRLENQWRNMRRDINTLASTYELANLDNNTTGVGRNVPSWAVGVFFARNPQTGGTITLTINPNGSANADLGFGTASFGTVNGTLLTLGNDTARLSQINNGIRTTRTDNGERIDYYRNNTNTGGGNDNWTNGKPSRWAVGTWYGRNPQTGGTITLFINSNGQVTITLDNGSVTYASMNDDRLNNNGIIARVTRINNGIRTSRLDNGERIDYFRTGYYDGNNNQNDVRKGNVPNWALGTFYGRNPQTGGNITLTVQSSGDVSVSMDGAMSYGSMYGSTFTLNGETARVTKISNGFRMTNNRNGERIDYRRQ